MKQRLLFLIFLYAATSTALAQDFYGPGIQEIKLEIKEPDWDRKLDALKNNDPDARMLAWANVNGGRFDSVGIRYKGNSSYFRSRKETYKKLPFNIKLNYLIKSQRLPAGQTNLKLSNGFLDPSLIRDPLAYEVIRNYMPAPQCNFVKLYINNNFWGLYNNSESIDGKFIKRHFGNDNGYLVKCDPDSWKKTRSADGCPKGENASLVSLGENPVCYGAFYEVEEEEAWEPFLKLVRVLNAQPADIESVLNVDQTLWMLALNNVLVNLDSYNGSLSHNYYLWFDSTGVAHPLIWDLNLAFGGWRRDMAFKKMSDKELIEYHPLAEIDNPGRPLINKLLANPLYRKVYLAYVRTIVDEQLVSGSLLRKAESLHREIDPWVKKDSLKLYPYEAFQKSLTDTYTAGADQIIGIRQLMEARGKWLNALDLLGKQPPVIAEPKHELSDSTCTVSVAVQNAENVQLCYRSNPGLAFQRSPMSGENGSYSATIPAQAVLQYFILAENGEAAATMPKRSSFAAYNIQKESN